MAAPIAWDSQSFLILERLEIVYSEIIKYIKYSVIIWG